MGAWLHAMTPRYSLSTLTARVIFIVCNVFYFVIALSLLSLGLVLLITQVDVMAVAGSDLYTGGVIVLIAGVLVILLSVLGIVSGAGMIRLLMGGYIFILVVTIILSEAGGLIGLLYKPYISDFPKFFCDGLEDYRPANSTEYDESTNKAIDHYQNTYHCCGNESAKDWETNSEFLLSTGGYLPKSCSCDLSQEHDLCGNWQISYDDTLVNQTAWKDGCANIIIPSLTSSTYALAIMGVTSGILQIPGLILAITLIVLISRNRYEGYVPL